jgi:hypothetical protein
LFLILHIFFFFLAGVSREVFALFENSDSAPLLPAMLEAAVKQAKSPGSQFKEKYEKSINHNLFDLSLIL